MLLLDNDEIFEYELFALDNISAVAGLPCKDVDGPEIQTDEDAEREEKEDAIRTAELIERLRAEDEAEAAEEAFYM
jgi:hypothetical protein